MPVAAFDTYTAAKTLRAAGFDESQAEAAVTVIRDAVAESTVTKADLQAGLAELRADMAELRTDMAELRAEVKENYATKADLAELRDDLKAHMAATYVTKVDFAAGLAELRDDLKAHMAATYVTKADFAAGLATLRAEGRGDLLRAVLALGAMMIVGFGAMLALLTTLLP